MVLRGGGSFPGGEENMKGLISNPKGEEQFSEKI